MSAILVPEYDNFLERVSTGLSKKVDLTKIPEWIVKNTRDPRNKKLRWSFAEHEFQKGILADASPEVIVRKCSQVGLSEVSVRLALAYCFMRDLTGIYVLPTKNFASKFSKSRIDAVVDRSPLLSSQKSKDSYSTYLKIIGDMQLYVAGSFSPDDAISVPAQFLVRDEYDFCNQAVLTSFDSRLGHSKEGEDFRRDFSTPTVSNYGIDKKFKEGTQAFYGVRHDRCGQWVVPKFLDDVVIPGFDGTARDLEKYHLEDTNVLPDLAHVRCPHCRKEITVANLADPAKRTWISAYPDRDAHSYQVQPFDVPTINPPARTIRQLKNYALKKDWINFKVGETYEDNASAFNPNAIDLYAGGTPINPDSCGAMRSNFRMGIDVGAVSYITIGIRIGGRLRVVHREQVICRGSDDALFNRACFLMDHLGLAFAVIDSMPDFNTADKLSRKYPGKFFACEYAERLASPLVTVDINEERRVIRAARDKRFDLLVSEYNSGGIEWTPSPENALVKEHIQGMKKMRQADEESAAATIDENLPQKWTKVGADHYLHALNYLHIADELAGTVGLDKPYSILPMARNVCVDKEGREQREQRERPALTHKVLYRSRR